MTTAPTSPELTVERTFLPLHKRAFGTATGLVAAIIVFALTVITIARPGENVFGLGLLGQYFTGYSLSWQGAFIGAAWAGFTGFVMGWFLAFCRNAFVAIMIVYVRTRAEFEQTRDFLDHI